MLIVILLLFTRFAVIGHPFGIQPHSKHNHRDSEYAFEGKSAYERQKERYENKYNNQQKRSKRKKKKQQRNVYDEYDDDFDDDIDEYGYARRRSRRSGRGYYDRYGSRRTNYGNSGGGGLFSASNLMMMLFFGTMIMGMMQNNGQGQGQNNGFNWNMMAMLPMLFGGFPMGGMHFRFGGRRRRFGRGFF